METQSKSLSQLLVSQLNVFSILVDTNYCIVDIMGNTKPLGFPDISLYSHIFNIFPESIVDALKIAINKNLKENVTEKKDVYYHGIDNSEKKVKLITSLHNSDNRIMYLITFIPLTIISGAKLSVTSVYECYEEALRQLEFSENRYYSFFENDPVMHFSVNPTTGLIADCNQFAVDKLGISNKEEVVGNPIQTIFTEEAQERSLYLLEKFKQEGFLKGEEIEIKTKKGKPIQVILYTTAQRDEKGNILFSRSTLVDISELKNTQKRLNQKRILLENMNTELEQFVSTCSHDLQEPLATIKFANDLIGKLYGNKLNDSGRNYIKYIDEAVDRLTSQIRSLLSHIRLGQNAKRTMVNIEDLVATVISDLGKSITNSRAKIQITSPLPTIGIYEVELRLLFQNLLSNAIKYSRKGKIPKIEISSYEDEEFTYFSVKDNGIGISVLDQKEIFKIFNRVNHKSPHKGDGVGLAHCKKIVRMHEGTIGIESRKGMGSTFTFKLKKNYIL